jgi:peptide/nickel transport system permease protein
MKNFLRSLKEIRQYPSAIVGLTIIAILIGLALYTIITIPYSEAIRLWRGGEEVWGETPRLASPAWFNYFSQHQRSESFVLDSRDPEQATKTVEVFGPDSAEVTIRYTFDYPYDEFHQDLTIFFQAQYASKTPHASLTWFTPDGREIRMGQFAIRRSETYRLSLDERLQRRLGGVPPQRGLFADPEAESPTPLPGTYTLQIRAQLFEDDSDVDARFVAYGTLYGLAGTDHRRRDLTVALLWGIPIALSFGLLAALGTTITTMFIAAFGVWFSGWVDQTIQRITEVNMILPFLPILIMVGTFQSRSIWVLLGWVIALSIFGGAIKNYRAIFMQVREAPYIEAAKAYGAGNMRIIVRYLVPRIIPVMIPSLVTAIPAYVFLEASLAVLGLGDPVLPTWGKVINEAYTNGALHNAQYYWVVQPAVLLMSAGLGFALLGFALDRIFNPKLRGL